MNVISAPEMDTRSIRSLCRHSLLYSDRNYRSENRIMTEVTIESANDLDSLMGYLQDGEEIPEGLIEYNDYMLTQTEYIPDPELDRALLTIVKALFEQVH